MNGGSEFSLFQVEFHVQESDGLFRDLVGELSVEYGFLRACNVTLELSEGMHLNVVVIVTYYVASAVLSLLINDFVLYLLL